MEGQRGSTRWTADVEPRQLASVRKFHLVSDRAGEARRDGVSRPGPSVVARETQEPALDVPVEDTAGRAMVLEMRRTERLDGPPDTA